MFLQPELILKIPLSHVIRKHHLSCFRNFNHPSHDKGKRLRGFQRGMFELCRYLSYLNIHELSVLHPIDALHISDISFNFAFHHFTSQSDCRSLLQDIQIIAFYHRATEGRIHFHHLCYLCARKWNKENKIFKIIRTCFLISSCFPKRQLVDGGNVSSKEFTEKNLP